MPPVKDRTLARKAVRDCKMRQKNKLQLLETTVANQEQLIRDLTINVDVITSLCEFMLQAIFNKDFKLGESFKNTPPLYDTNCMLRI